MEELKDWRKHHVGTMEPIRHEFDRLKCNPKSSQTAASSLRRNTAKTAMSENTTSPPHIPSLLPQVPGLSDGLSGFQRVLCLFRSIDRIAASLLE